MKAVRMLSILVFGLFLTTTVHAKDLKIAYVELGNVFNNYQKTKDFDAVLQKESQDAQKQMEDMYKKIQDDQNKLALLKEDEKQKLQSTIDKEKIDFLAMQKEKRAELAKKFEDMRKDIILEIEKTVSAIAAKDGYTFIFNDSVLLYGEKESNISELVLKTLNGSYPGKK